MDYMDHIEMHWNILTKSMRVSAPRRLSATYCKSGRHEIVCNSSVERTCTWLTVSSAISLSHESDPCVYVNKETGIIIAMWVDDLTIFGRISTVSTISRLSSARNTR